MLIRAAKAIVVDPSGDILIVRRSKTHPHVPLTNDIPGGKLEYAETMLEGLTRELREETGIDISNQGIRSLGSVRVDEFYGHDYEIELFEVKLAERPDIVLDFEHDKFAWVPLEDATILAELYEEMFSMYKQANSL